MRQIERFGQEKFFYPIRGTEPSESNILLLHNTTVIKNYFYFFSSLYLQIESERFLFPKKKIQEYIIIIYMCLYI